MPIFDIWPHLTARCLGIQRKNRIKSHCDMKTGMYLKRGPAAFLLYLLIQPPSLCRDQMGQILETKLWLKQKPGQQLATAAIH